MSANIGKLWENQVYLDLHRQGKEIFYYHTKDGYEIDFITKNARGQYEIIQVVWDAKNTATLKREERALLQAEKELGFSGKLLDWQSYIKTIVLERLRSRNNQ